MGENPEVARVAVSGAAGQISYSLLFRIAAGDMLGDEQPVALQLLEIPRAMEHLEGVCMELADCAFPLLHSVHSSSDAEEAFDNSQYILLPGAFPRGPGMERSELLEKNAQIFMQQGRAIAAAASPSARVLVIGNPANSNTFAAYTHAPGISPRQFTAMTRLDHNRAAAMLAAHGDVRVQDIDRLTIWGNHSATQFPDLHHARLRGQPALSRVEEDWYRHTMIPGVQQRGARVITARGASSAASAAHAAIEHMRDWVQGTPADDWISMGVVSDGSYGVEEGLVCSFPVRCDAGEWEIVQGLEMNEFSRRMLEHSVAELAAERDTMQRIFPG